jgi:beta-glucosidase
MIFRSLGCAFSILGVGVVLVAGCSDSSSGTQFPPGMGMSGSGSSLAGATTVGGSGSGNGSVAGSATTTGGAGITGGVTGGGAAPVGGDGVGGVAPSGGMGGSAAGTGGGTAVYTIPTVTWPSAECIAKADDLVGKMTNAEKAEQLVMGQNPSTNLVTSQMLGTVFCGGTLTPPGGSKPSDWAGMIDGYIAAAAASRLQIPIFYGIDAVHGASKSTSTVLFPHNAGLGSSRDPQLVEDIGHVTAIEAMAQGMSWAYAPSFGVAFDDRWGRVFESYSEDPEIVGLLGAAAVLGIQGRGGLGTGNPGMVACGKHFAGDGQGTYGTSSKAGSGGLVDRGNVQIDEATMRKLGVAPYERAIKAGIGTIMVSDGSWNGANMTGSTKLITSILKGELAFKGAVATDWEAAAGAGGPVAVINAGVDVLMEPTNWQSVAGSIAAAIGNQISTQRANDAVHRVLTVKCQAGLFGKTRDNSLMSQIGSAEHRALGRKAVSESLVLMQNNNNALPLKKGGKFWVVGSGSDSLERQAGGWSVSWQGGGGGTTGTTIKAAIAKVGSVVGTAAEADAAVVVVSEKTYAEFVGDTSTLKTIAQADWDLLQQARASGKPVIALVVSGRPVLIADHLTQADAWIAAWLPGTEGDGVADVLFGTTKFTGKLSHSWPKTEQQTNVNFGDAGYDPQFKLGDGLTF